MSKLSFSNIHDDVALAPSGCPAAKSIRQAMKSMDDGCSKCSGSKCIATRLCTSKPRAMRLGGKYGSAVSIINVHISKKTLQRYRAQVSCVAYLFCVSTSRRLKSTKSQSREVGKRRKPCSMGSKNFSCSRICCGVMHAGTSAMYPMLWSHCATDNAWCAYGLNGLFFFLRSQWIQPNEE